MGEHRFNRNGEGVVFIDGVNATVALERLAAHRPRYARGSTTPGDIKTLVALVSHLLTENEELWEEVEDYAWDCAGFKTKDGHYDSRCISSHADAIRTLVKRGYLEIISDDGHRGVTAKDVRKESKPT